MMKKLVPALLFAFVSPAIADVDHRNLSHLAGWVAGVKADLASGSYSRASTGSTVKDGVAQCKAVLDDARAKGMKTVKGYKPLGAYGGTKISEGGYEFEVTLEQGEKVCEDVQFAATMMTPYNAFFTATETLHMYEIADPSPEAVPDIVKQADECGKLVDGLVAAKIPASTPYVIKKKGGKDVLANTVGELKTGVCDTLRATVQQYAKAAKEAEEKKKAPYLKAGINDDKLWLMMTYGNGVILPGGKSTSDLKAYAKANVLFLHLSGDPDGLNIVTHTVRKHKFKGNKLVDQTEKTYRKKYGERLPNSAFK